MAVRGTAFKLLPTSAKRCNSYWAMHPLLHPVLSLLLKSHPPESLVVESKGPHDADDGDALDAHQLALIMLRAGSPGQEGGHVLCFGVRGGGDTAGHKYL